MSYSKSIDEKWQKVWKENKIYKYEENSSKPKYYSLEMFSYPSAAKLHLGHWFNFAPADSYARYKSMKGFNVFHPMGFDAFGLPAENFAIKTGIHPKDSTANNIETMKVQLEGIGATYDWDYTLQTCSPEYYKWTQWIFGELYKKGLAYQKNAPVNWCPSCNTVLANEQVENGTCERCKSIVQRRKLKQWFFKTTAYAEELLAELKNLDWPESTKKVQENWIGKSEGAEVKFKIADTEHEVTVFTTRADTLYGVTYMVIAPEADIVKSITTAENKENVEKYIAETIKASEIERMATDREKTGTFTGAYAINPVNNEKVPVWIADYVLEDYGTGCVMAVPAHDERDYEFAKKFNLPIRQVISSNNEDEVDLENKAFTSVETGVLINSDILNGLSVKDAQTKIFKYLEDNNIGNKKTTYKLKDWLVSRQRYWGSPIPIIYCDNCGEVVVPKEQLPVELPYNVEFKPDGDSPLKKSKEFMNCTCPKCGKSATREADTLDTFVCSSWYFLRYPNANNTENAWDTDVTNKLLPVDMYIGGKEHAAMHLIYARFMTKALRDCGYLNFGEPFKKLVHQGMILGPDGNKMSKSKGNTVAPDEYVDQYGADVFRMYLMFGFAYTDGGPWKTEGLKAMVKYFSRIENLIARYMNNEYILTIDKVGERIEKLLYVKNRTIKSMQTDLENLGFNTAIARSMEFVNELVEYEQQGNVNKEILTDCIETLLKVLAPLAPHFTEELWEIIGKTNSIHKEEWPKYNEAEMELKEIEIPVQVNGKVKAVVKVKADLSEDLIKATVKENANIKAALENKTILKEIFVQGKIYNIVCK